MIELSQNLSFYVIIGGLGLMIGSFCNVIIYRLPIMLHNNWRQECLIFLEKQSNFTPKLFNLLVPRSHCPKCQNLIPIWHNIPLFSYIFLRGKCHNCNESIPWRYPLVEMLCCVCAIFVAHQFGANLQMVALLILTWALITLIFIDFDQQLLPDNITLLMLWLGLLVNAFGIFTTPTNAILGAAFGYSSLWLTATVYKLLRKQEGMGHGDFKLLATFGAWLGWQMLPITILLASLLGAVVGICLILIRKHHYTAPMPFGPYLALAGWAMFFIGPNIITWYSHLLLIS